MFTKGPEIKFTCIYIYKEELKLRLKRNRKVLWHLQHVYRVILVNSRIKCVTFQDLEDESQFSDEEFEKFQKEYHDKHKVSKLCSHSWISCQYLSHTIVAIDQAVTTLISNHISGKLSQSHIILLLC